LDNWVVVVRRRDPGAGVRRRFLTLSEVPDADNLWLLSTGTGIGPFLSIFKTEAPWHRFKQVVLVHAVRTADGLNYVDTIQRIAQDHPEQFRFVLSSVAKTQLTRCARTSPRQSPTAACKLRPASC
jgi:ferredoxin-NADP reductase